MTEHASRKREYPSLGGSYEERVAKLRGSWSPEVAAYAASLAEAFDFARRIREYRTALGLTQTQMGAIIEEDQGDVSRLERGELNPSTARANRIMDRLRAYAEATVGRGRDAAPVVAIPLSTASTVAAYLCAVHDDEESFSVLKLQKLLYYAQGYALALLRRPLFPERIKAWDHGPVVPQVWHEYKDQGRSLARPVDLDVLTVDPEVRSILDRVYAEFGQFEAWRLREMTHEEQPWMETPQNEEISLDLMLSYFERRLATSRLQAVVGG